MDNAADDRLGPAQRLAALLERARRRADSETRGSPAWDAAMAEVDELENRLIGARATEHRVTTA